ncbi:MAG: hypothetical protein O3B75_04130 [Planctomycetota bacterium]|nr:hypothetical protein [Planctomycetota bacterium]
MTTRSTRLFTNLCALSFSISLGSNALAVDPVINEIRVDQPGIDLSEYVEFKGTPGSSLEGLTLVVMGDDDAASPPNQNGTIESVVELSGNFSSSGFFVLAESTYQFGTADQVAILNFENPDNVTFLLVSGFTGSNGQDLDTNNDGILDVLPWTAIISSVALIQTANPDGTNADFVYSTNRVGPDGTSSPAQIWLCADSNTWRIGSSDTTLGTDSPGVANPTCGSGVAIRLSEIRIDQPGTDIDEYVEIEGPAGFNMNGFSIIVIGDNNTTGAIDLAGSIESITLLDGAIIPSTGYLLIAKATMTIAVPDFVVAATAMNFENSDNVTFLLVSGFTGALNDDVDTDNNCVFDVNPWTAIIDSVSLTGLDTTCTYSSSVAGPDGNYTTAHAFRCFADGVWSVGAYDHLAGGDTPGAQNRACGLGPVLECGEVTAGECTVAHANPYCDDSVCCSLICTTQPTCCTVAWDAACAEAATTSCGQTGSSSCVKGVVAFSEIRIDQPSTDLDEFVELVGAPGTSLNDMSLIVIGDGSSTAASGVIEAVVNLAGQTIPADGYFAMSESTFTQGIAAIDYVLNGTNPLNFENSDNLTIMLVRNFTGANAQDLDSDDNGVFNTVVPWTEIVDIIALIKTTTLPPTGTEWVYGPNTIGPDTTYVPAHIWRCADTGCWNIGKFDILESTDTPGVANLNCGAVCQGDYNQDGQRNGSDLATLLSAWGTQGGDITGDGTTGGADLAALLSGWGPCP